MKKILATIGIVFAGFLGWFFYEKPQPPFGATKTNFELAQDCVKNDKITNCLTNLSIKEKSQIKAQEIAKLNHVGKYIKDDFEIEILSLEPIEIKGIDGVEILAKAWKNSKQLGFGKDG